MAFLNITKKQNKEIVKKIDQEDYMRLGKPTSRLDLFNFAVALGVRQGIIDDSEGISNKESFVRDEYIGNERYMLSSLFFVDYVLKKHADLESLIDDAITFPLAEKYAEEGFNILNDHMNKKGGKNFMYMLLSEMDTKYHEIENDLPKEHVGYEYEEPPQKMAADDSSPFSSEKKESELDYSMQIRFLREKFNIHGSAFLYCYDFGVKTVGDLVSLYQEKDCLPKVNTLKKETVEVLNKILMAAGVSVKSD